MLIFISDTSGPASGSNLLFGERVVMGSNIYMFDLGSEAWFEPRILDRWDVSFGICKLSTTEQNTEATGRASKGGTRRAVKPLEGIVLAVLCAVAVAVALLFGNELLLHHMLITQPYLS